MIDVERYRRIDEIFQAALELDPHERSSYISQACSDDEPLLKEIEYLLASDEQDWKLIATPAFEMVAPLLARDQPELDSGDSVGHYNVVSLLGVGGMGHVYLAEDSKLGRKVALKLLPKSYTQDGSRLRRFQQEARAASALNHPNILTIHELGEVDGQQFIATEFVEGETLRERLKRGPLSLPETLDIAIQIAGALVVAHKAGIVHRDIKPENIMVRRDGYVKVLDFGLAKLTEQYEPTTRAQIAENVNVSSGLVMGTVKYMSPEQARGEQVDQRSDLFSFGVVLYEMLTGHAPFKGEDTSHLVRSILKDDPRRLAEYAPDAPEQLQQIVSKALIKNRAKRYQTAEDLLADLKTLRQQVELSTESQSIVRAAEVGTATVSTQSHGMRTASTAEYFVSQIRQHKPIAAAGLIGLVILLGGVGYPLRKWISKRAVPARELKTTMLTTTGHAMDPAISPDGKYVAYRTEDGGVVSLRIREIATNNETEITPPGDRFVFDPIFSPDGKYLYYESIADDPPPDYPARGFPKNYWRQLYRRPVSGGPGEKIVDYLTSKITFSPNGRELAFIRVNLRERVGTLVIANADGTEERSVISRKVPNYFQTDFYGSGPSWAADGKRIAYAARDAADGYDRIFEVNLETNAEKPLTTQKWGHGIGDATWLPDGSGILFNGANTSISNAIWRLSYPGAELQRITNDANKYIGLSVTGDSNTLVTSQVADYIELWLAPDADASRARRIMPGRHDGRYGFEWTPDGRIVFTRETSDNSDIWIANADGTNQKQLTINVDQEQSPTVTSDGRYIVFQSNRTGGDHIWRMDLDGSNQKQLTFGAVERQPGCSPDSKWVVYTSWETGKPTPWRISVEGGTPQQITDVQCGFPRVSHDGKLIACSSGGNRVPIFSFEGGQPVATLELPKGAWWDGSWTLDDRAIRYAVNNFRDPSWGIYGTMNWWVQPIAGGPPKQLTFFKPDQPGATSTLRAAWSPDGKDLLYASFEIKSDVVMMSGLK